MFTTALVSVGLLLAACASDDEASDDSSPVSEGVDTTTAESTTESTTESTAESTTESTPTAESTEAPPVATDAPAEAEPAVGGEVSYLLFGATPTTFDPVAYSAVGVANSNGTYFSALYGMLLYYDYATATTVPWMAESMTTEDGIVWTLAIKPDIKFTDGTAYDAEAVKLNWERIADPANGSAAAETAAAIASLEVVDPLTLSITLAAPDFAFDFKVSIALPFVASPTALADVAAFVQEPVGAGPFTLESYIEGAAGTAVFVRNEAYFDSPRPYIEKLTIGQAQDNEQRVNAMLSGDANLVDVRCGSQDQVTDAGFTLVDAPDSPGGGSVFMINASRAPFDNVIARRALAAALDYDGYNEAVLRGCGTSVTSLFSEATPYYDAGLALPRHDPALAQELIDQYVAETGLPLTIEFVAPEGAEAMSSFYQAQLGEFENVEFNITPVAVADYVTRLATGQFDMGTWQGKLASPVADLSSMMSSTGQQNFGRYSNPELDDLLAQAGATNDQAELQDLLAQVQQIVIDEVPWVWTLKTPAYLGHVSDLDGLVFHVDGAPIWDRLYFVD